MRPHQYHALAHKEYARVYFRAGGPFGTEPRTKIGRDIALTTFRGMLRSAKSPHAAGWLEMLESQFPVIADEGSWSDFLGFSTLYYASVSNPEMASYTQQIDTVPIVQAAYAR